MATTTYAPSRLTDMYLPSLDHAMSLVSSAKFLDEAELIDKLLDNVPYDSLTSAAIREDAIRAVESVRLDSSTKPLLDTFLTDYSLSNKEGVVLMCLAESLLRIPDQRTAERLIADKIQLRNSTIGTNQMLSLDCSTLNSRNLVVVDILLNLISLGSSYEVMINSLREVQVAS